MAIHQRPTLLRKLLGWLISYLILLTLVLFFAAYYVHEQAEHEVWQALLDSELHSILEQMHRDPDYRWQDSDTMRLFIGTEHQPLPDVLADLTPGLHDDIDLDNVPSVVMVHHDENQRTLVLALDITDFEKLESFITRWALIGGSAMFLITLIMAWIGINRLVHPLSHLARNIATLQPQHHGQRLQVAARGSAELEVIATAINNYIQRNERFVERERAFISTASHELRTPIATIVGASELALKQADLSTRSHQQLERIYSAATGVEQLIHLLLILARDPARLVAHSEPLALHQLLPSIVADHMYLAQGKELEIVIEHSLPCQILAPEALVQAAIGNLLRNAIENSDRGIIRLSLSDQAVISVVDPGHGMSPEEIAAVYARLSRGQHHDHPPRSGIGLDLIARLCEHLSWRLEIDSQQQQGTRILLDMRASLLACTCS